MLNVSKLNDDERSLLARIEGLVSGIESCRYGNRAFADCEYVIDNSARLKGQQRVQLRVQGSADQKIADRAQELADLKIQIESAQGQERELQGQMKSLQDQVREKSERISTIESINRQLDRYQGIIGGSVRDQELDRLRGEIKDIETSAERERGQLTVVQTRSNKQFERIVALFSSIVSAAISSEFSGSVNITPEDIEFAILRNTSMGGEAVESLAVVLADVCGLLASVEGMSCHPGFLLHDSPREADLGAGLYASVLRMMADVHATLGGGTSAPYQYILTTTTPPPEEAGVAVRETLSDREDQMLLFRQRLGLPKDALNSANPHLVATMPLEIQYESSSFPPASGINGGWASLSTSWDELIWAAVTVGRPNWHYVFQHGNSSAYEALFRFSLLRMALEQSGPAGWVLRRTAAARSLDPSEKGAVNYFVGMTMCKLFAADLLQAPWALHLDVFGASVGALLTQRSRPDLLAQIHGTNEWISMESKGRISPPDSEVKRKAKNQSRRVAVQNATMRHNIGAISYLKNDVLRFYWEDPMPDSKQEKYMATLPADAWRYYYEPIISLVQDSISKQAAGPRWQIAIADLSVEIHPAVSDLLLRRQWAEARNECNGLADDFRKAGFHLDGLKLQAGATWLKRFSRGGEVES